VRIRYLRTCSIRRRFRLQRRGQVALLREGRQCPRHVANAEEQMRYRLQAAGHVQPSLHIRSGHGRQLAPQCQRLALHRQRFLLVADLLGQLAQLEVAIRQQLSRLRVGLARQHLLQIGIEAGGFLQQLRSQLLELGVLQQKVFADAGVERGDRFLRRREAGLHLRLLLGQLRVLALQLDVGLPLHRQHRTQPAEGRQR
jgi:hypothetical protein